MGVEPALVNEPELFIRDPVDEGGVVEALFDALGEKTTPAIDVVFWYDRRWSSVIREMIAKLMWMSSAARSSFVFPRVIVVDSVRASRTLLSLASFRTGLLPFFYRRILSPQSYLPLRIFRRSFFAAFSEIPTVAAIAFIDARSA